VLRDGKAFELNRSTPLELDIIVSPNAAP